MSYLIYIGLGAIYLVATMITACVVLGSRIRRVKRGERKGKIDMVDVFEAGGLGLIWPVAGFALSIYAGGHAAAVAIDMAEIKLQEYKPGTALPAPEPKS